MEFAEQFKAERKRLGLTQQGVVDKLKIPRRTIQDWESGRMSPPEWCQRLILAEMNRIEKERG